MSTEQAHPSISSEAAAYLESNGLQLLPVDARVARIAKMVGGMADRLELPHGRRKPTIELCFVDSVTVGGGAIRLKDPDHYVITLPQGTTTCLMHSYCSILASPHVFDDVGDVSLETQGAPLGQLHSDMFAILNPPDEGIPPYTLRAPRCTARLDYALILTQLGILVIVLHELGHILEGHLDVVPLPPRQYRALELSADRFAVNTLTRLLLTNIRTANAPPVIATDAAATKAIARALYLLHMHEEAAFAAPPNVHDRVHPLPRHRQLIGIDAIVTAYKAFGGAEADIACALFDVGPETEEVYRKTTGRTLYDIDYVVKAFTDPLLTELSQIWQLEIRPMLERFAYVKLATTGPSEQEVWT